MTSSQVSTVSAQVTPELTSFLTSNLRSTAKSVGWPGDLVSKLSVIENNGQLFVSYPDEVASEVHDLEYGTEGNPPRSALRAFATRLGSKPSEVIADATLQLFLEGAI